MNVFKHNYRIPPVDTSLSNVNGMLNYFGVELKDDKDEVPIRVFDENRLPKLSCPKSNNPDSQICLSFCGPSGFGLQSAFFDPELLLSAISDFNNLGIPFKDSLHCSNFIAFILSAFIINRSVLKRVYYHKKGYFKLPLQPSVQKINRLLNTK